MPQSILKISKNGKLRFYSLMRMNFVKLKYGKSKVTVKP
jgi:hypothetical protein